MAEMIKNKPKVALKKSISDLMKDVDDSGKAKPLLVPTFKKETENLQKSSPNQEEIKTIINGKNNEKEGQFMSNLNDIYKNTKNKP